MADDEQHWEELIAGLRSGDEQVAREFFTQYGAMLHRVAENQMASGLRRRIDPDDVVQSAFRTFFRRANEGQFRFPDSQKLWSLLCAITLTKVRSQARFHLRQKRGLDRESHPDPVSSTDGAPSFEAVDPGLSPAAAAEFADQFEQILEALDEEERQVVDLRLQDYTCEEIGESLGVSERTVRRILKRLRSHLERVFAADE